MASLSGIEFQSFIVLGKIFVTVYAGEDGIVGLCFAIEMSSATQNWLKMPYG